MTASQESKSFSGIVRTPEICGGSARIGHTRIPVWTLEVARRQGLNDVSILQAFPMLNAADLATAWDYVCAHFGEIERDIQENED